MARSGTRDAPDRGGSENPGRSNQGVQWFTAGFMILFLTCAVLAALANPALLQAPEEPLLDGSWSGAYQESFDASSPLLGVATTTWGVIEYALFGQGRPGVLVGSDEWLFTAEEFAYEGNPADARRLLDHNLDLIARVDAELEESGAELLVALLPAKARVYREQLGRYELPQLAAERYELALAGLTRRNVAAPDLLTPLLEAKARTPTFLRTDTHWTPEGARVSAQVLARAAARIGEFSWLHDEEHETAIDGTRPLRGDLTGFIPLGPLYDELGPADDAITLMSTSAVAAPGNDLFASVEIPVVVVGTSYSQDERWNFVGALREALGSDALVAARRGRGPYPPMEEYLSGEAYRSSPPQLVVWEIPERYLTEPWPPARSER